MSQAKVDRYKEEKKNRKKIMAKEKRMRIAGYVAGCLVAAGIIGWAGYSGNFVNLVGDIVSFHWMLPINLGLY